MRRNSTVEFSLVLRYGSGLNLFLKFSCNLSSFSCRHFFSSQSFCFDLLLTVNVTYCYNSTVDIAFIVDDSSAVSSSDWAGIKQYLISITDRFYVAQNFVRFALIRFSSSASIAFTFSQYTNNYDLRNAINNLGYSGSSPSRVLNSAFQLALTGLFQSSGRSGASQVRLLLKFTMKIQLN